MADNAQKTPMARSLNEFAIRTAENQIQITGKGLPCSVVAARNSIITVRFEVQSGFTLPNVTVPMFGPEYVRYPIQPGDKGIVITADAYLGGVSGLGGGVAGLTRRGNLSTLVFLPISNTAWSSVDANAVTVYGPNGVALRNAAATSTLILLPAGIALVGQNYITLTCGACTIQMTPTTITITDTVAHTSPATMNAAWSALVTWLNGHIHSDPQGGNTGVPVAPFSGGSIAP